MTEAKKDVVDFDLDAYEGKEVKPAFRFKLDGKVFTADNPATAMDWQDAVDAGPITVFYNMLGDQASEFSEIGLTLEKFGALTERFAKHFGLVGPDGRPKNSV